MGMLFALLLCLLSVSQANAATTAISGWVRGVNSSVLQGAYVYATDAGSPIMKYGPVLAANPTGTYNLNVPVSGTYDVHFVAPLGSGHVSTAETGVQVGTTSYSLNKNLAYTSQTFTLSGRLTDQTGAGIPSTTVKIFRVGAGINNLSTQSTTTNSNGDYSLAATPGNYSFVIESLSQSAIPGINSFKLQQPSTAGAINLSQNLSIDLVLRTATLNVQPHHNNGQLGNYRVTAYSRAGITTLYPGDPGTNITQIYSVDSTGTSVPIKTIVGARYVAGGLDSADYFNSGICGWVSNTYDCLRLPLEVTGGQSIDLPQTSSATRTFSGTVVDGNNIPIENTRVRLVKSSDQTPTAYTNANGEFSINAQPGFYTLKVDRGGYINGVLTSYEITQNGNYVNLTNENVFKAIEVKTIDMVVSAFNSYGQPDYYDSIRANTSLGTTTLYDGDPGSSVKINSGWHFMADTNTASFTTIYGAKYLAKGLGIYSSDVNTNNSICKTTGIANTADCITSEFTITGPVAISVPQ